jgi:large conductance mechanosensitive channel
MLKEFKEFALKGNVLDMAVGIIIGAAFTTIVKSAVDDMIMPPIGLLLGGVDFSDLFINLSSTPVDSLAAAKDAGVAVIAYGKFINAVISFVIVAWVLFLVIRGMNSLKRKDEAAPAAPAEPPKQEVLLGEIRDLLKNK